MKKKYIYSVSLFTLFFCCKKQSEEKSIINSQDFFSKITDISKLKKAEKIMLNDSTYRIKGNIDSYQVTGYLTENNKKIDWWKIVDTKNNEEIAKIEYRLVDKKVFANQYKIFDNSKLNVYRSKYYTFMLRKDKDEDISYYFYVPKSKDVIESKGRFLYSVYDIKKNKEMIYSKCECTNTDNQFQCTFSIPNKNNIVISGVFFEVSQIKNGKMGGSEIYVRDTIR